jgi:hypothetical protein
MPNILGIPADASARGSKKNRSYENTVVEAAGVEPASEKARREKATCVSDSVVVGRRIRTGKKTAA